MKTVHQTILTLTLLSLPLLSARAIDFNPDFPSTGEGGAINNQDFTVGAGGSVFELDGFVNIAGQDLNGAAVGGTSAQLSLDPLPAGLDYTFSYQLSADLTDLTLIYTFVNNTGSDITGFKFLPFLDAEIDESDNTYFNEFAETNGTPAPGQNFEVDEPGFVFGDIFDNLLDGQLDGTNALPAANPDDVAMGLAFSFAMGSFGAGGTVEVRVMISEDLEKIGTFSITQRDSDPGSLTTITFSGMFIPIPPSECAILGDQAVKLGNGTVVRESDVCSNGKLTTGFNVAILDGGDVQQAGSGNGPVQLGNGTYVSGNVLVNGDLIFRANSRVDGDAEAGLSLSFVSSNNTVAGACRYGSALINGGVFSNSCGSESLASPPTFSVDVALPACPVNAPGGPDIATAANVNYGVLPSGNYGHVRFGNGNTVELNGDYTFKSLAFGFNNRVEISGASTLEVEQELTFGNGTKQILSGGTTAADIVYLVQSDVDTDSDQQGAGFNTELYGTICGPQATIKIGNGTTFKGAVYAKYVTLGYNVDFTAAPAF